jgi:hypothetical protein
VKFLIAVAAVAGILVGVLSQNFMTPPEPGAATQAITASHAWLSQNFM